MSVASFFLKLELHTKLFKGSVPWVSADETTKEYVLRNTLLLYVVKASISGDNLDCMSGSCGELLSLYQACLTGWRNTAASVVDLSAPSILGARPCAVFVLNTTQHPLAQSFGFSACEIWASFRLFCSFKCLPALTFLDTKMPQVETSLWDTWKMYTGLWSWAIHSFVRFQLFM